MRVLKKYPQAFLLKLAKLPKNLTNLFSLLLHFINAPP
jgi:hypothetical protein